MKTNAKTSPYASIIGQLVAHVMDDKRNEQLKDLEKLSSASLGTIFSRFGLGGSKVKPKPTDNPIIMIFVIGGITFSEIKEIKDTIKNKQVNSATFMFNIGAK